LKGFKIKFKTGLKGFKIKFKTSLKRNLNSNENLLIMNRKYERKSLQLFSIKKAGFSQYIFAYLKG